MRWGCMKNDTCNKCGTSDRYTSGKCKQCAKNAVKKWRDENRAKKNETDRKWNAANKKSVQESRKKYYSENKEAERRRKQEWEKNNRAACVARRNRRKTRETKAGGSFTGDEWIALCEKYNNRCLCCGKKRKLTIDHVIPVSMGGTSDISNLQPLCKSCNCSKAANIIDYR